MFLKEKEAKDCSQNNTQQSGAGGPVLSENSPDLDCPGLSGNPGRLQRFGRHSHKKGEE